MSFASLHKLVTYVFAGLGLFALSLGGELTLPSLVAIFLAFFASIFVEGPRLEEPGWQRGWTGALLALALVQIVRGFSGEPFLPLALEFTAALQVSRLCNRRSAVEHRQIALLAFLHLVSATVLSTELVYGIAFVGFVIAAPWMLALTHLRGEIEGHYVVDASRADPGDEASRALVRRVLGSRRVVGPSFLAGTAVLSVPLFVFTALVFVAFPRIGFGVLSFGQEAGEHAAGFGDDVELGEVGVIRDNPTVVLRVVPPGLEEPVPERAGIRMRGTSFDHYDGRRWTRTTSMSRALGHMGYVNTLTRPIDRRRDARWEVILEHLDEPVVFLPEHTVALEFGPRYSSGFALGETLVIGPGLDVRYDSSQGIGARYTAWVSVDPDEPLREELRADEARRYLQLPPLHERVEVLAETWTAGAPNDRAIVDAILAHLHGPEFSYSLEMRDPDGLPPVEAFLFRDRAGHCEYYSTAMVIMLRARGVPAREVTGFLGGTWNPFGRYYAITQGDAHTWVEAWIEGRGWVTFDPTPPGRGLADARVNGLLRWMRDVVDAIRTRWDDDVVGYDLGAQRTLARTLGALLGFGGSSGGSGDRGGSSERRSSPASVPWGLIAVLVACVVGYVVWRRARGREAAVELPPASREVVALYRELERALAARGAARPAVRTPREHAEALREAGFAGSDLVARVTDRYVEVRYGGASLAAGELDELRSVVRTIATPPS